MNSPAAAAAALLVAIVGQSSAMAEPSRAESPMATEATTATPRFDAVRVSVPPKLDGRLDDAVWALSRGSSQFTQQVPYGGSAPSEPTTVKVLYDAEAVYIGFDCTQTKTAIVGHLTRRDEDSESDWVWISIDSRNDFRSATYFAVNVAGVLVDGTMHDGSTFGIEWDENWEGRTAITQTGWSAEIRIPLRVLRFSPHIPVQSWGIWASRFTGLLQEKDDWPYIPREVAAPIPFFGRLDDLRDLPRGGIVELKPFGLGQVRHRDTGIAGGGTDLGGSAGLDLKLHLTQSLTLDAAVNPDFAQVEADQLILNLNNYEIFYPEKRPLFLEGADLFSTPLGLFYSRRIGSSPATPTLKSGTSAELVDVPGAATIYAAAKVAGRVGDAWTVGALSALAARNDYEVLAGGIRKSLTAEPLTSFNVLRIRRDIGNRAHLGAIFTGTGRFERTSGDPVCPATGTTPIVPGDRCFRDAGVAGLDGLWRSPGADYVAAGQLVGSVVRGGQPDIQPDGTSIASGDSGVGGWLRLAKEGGRHFLGEVAYTGIGRRMTYNDLGFMPRQNLRELKAGLELRSLDPGPLTLERRLRLDLAARRSLDGLDLGATAELGVTVRLRGFWNLHAAVDVAPGYFDDREVGDGTALERASYAGGKVEVSSDPRWRWGAGLKGEVRVLGGGTVVDAQGTVAWRPLSQFKIELDPQISYHSGEQRFASNAALNTMPAPNPNPYVFGRLLARDLGATIRVQYTFTPRLSLQTFAQLFLSAGHFDDFRQAPRLTGSRVRLADLQSLPSPQQPTDADFEQAALNVNVVLRWEYSLGSTLFVVYSRSQVPDVALGMGETAGLRASAIGRVPAVDTILVKLSLWWAS